MAISNRDQASVEKIKSRIFLKPVNFIFLFLVAANDTQNWIKLMANTAINKTKFNRLKLDLCISLMIPSKALTNANDWNLCPSCK